MQNTSGGPETPLLRGSLLAALLFLLPIAAQAQPSPTPEAGSIFGFLVDADTGEALIGANVVIRGTTVGTSTDLDGRYEIARLDPGLYTLEIRYIGYTTAIVSDVEVQAGFATRVDLALEPESFDLEEVVVEARAILDSDATLLRARQKSVAMSDAISAETISRSGSGDAASAMSKVTGASVLGGKYVYIRGLGDRYALTQLNGSSLPSADPDRKAFNLDLFPSSLLDNIVTLKTFTPDKPGSFSGGLVDVSTKDFPERLTFQLSASTAYNSQSTFSDVILYDGSATDWLGMDDGSRDIPSSVLDAVEAGTLPTELEALRDPEKAALLDAVSKSFNNVMAPSTREAPLSRSFSAALGNQVLLAGRPLGFNASLTYNREVSGYENGAVGRWELIGGQVDGVSGLTPVRYFGQSAPTESVTTLGYDRNGRDEVSWGGLATVAYKPHPMHSLAATFMRTQSGSSEARSLAGYWSDLTGESTFETRVLGYKERRLESVQGKGEHVLGPLTAKWKASYALNTQYEPDLRYFSNHFTLRDTDGVIDTLYQSPASLYPAPTRFFRDLSESTGDVSLDLQLPVRLGPGRNGSIKAGAARIDVDRDFNERRFEYKEGRGVRFGNFGGDIPAYFAASGVIDTTSTGRVVFGNYIKDASSPRSNYEGTQSVGAVYAMVDVPVIRSLRFVGGARYETTEMETVSGDSTLEIGKLSNRDWLPSANLIWSLGDRMNVRTAFTKTLARPTFRELAPYATFDFVGDYVFRGNAGLKRTLITNYDLRWEWFVRPGEIFAVSGFYKRFENPIERVIQTSVGNNSMSIQNVDRADVYGLEVEGRGRLGADRSFLSRFVVGANATLVRSQVRIPEEEMVVIRSADPDAGNTRSLDGQSPYLFNFDLTYEQPDASTVVSLIYNIFGDRLVTVSEGASPDIFERSRATLDVVASHSLRSGVRLKLSAKNLLDSDHTTSQRFKDQEYVYALYRTGRTISLGVSYSL